MGYPLVIDESGFESEDPILTGRQLLLLANRTPIEEHLVMFLGPGRQLEDIDLEETVDLREPGREFFITFRSDRSFNLELDGRRQPWGADGISESALRRLADVGDEYRVWLERQAEEDRLLERGEIVVLAGRGVERFYTGREDTQAGRCAALPEPDQRYVRDHELRAEAIYHESQKGVVFPQFVLPNRFDRDKTDVMLVLPAGYPDVPPDMFYCFPWIKLRGANAWPRAADKGVDFAGRKWQRWSRHNSDWRAGVDGIHTMIRRILAALRSAS